jgi:hypothetical protein
MFYEVLGHKDYRFTFADAKERLEYVFRGIYCDFPNRPCRTTSICDLSTSTGLATRHPHHAFGEALDLQYFTWGLSNRTQSPTKEQKIWIGDMLDTTVFDTQRNWECFKRIKELFPMCHMEVHTKIKAALESFVGGRVLWLVASDGYNHDLHVHVHLGK